MGVYTVLASISFPGAPTASYNISPRSVGNLRLHLRTLVASMCKTRNLPETGVKYSTSASSTRILDSIAHTFPVVSKDSLAIVFKLL